MHDQQLPFVVESSEIPEVPGPIGILVRRPLLPSPCGVGEFRMDLRDVRVLDRQVIADVVDETLVGIARIQLISNRERLAPKPEKIIAGDRATFGSPPTRIETPPEALLQKLLSMRSWLVDLINGCIKMEQVKRRLTQRLQVRSQVTQHDLSAVEIEKGLDRTPEGRIPTEPKATVGCMTKFVVLSELFKIGKRRILKRIERVR